MINFIAVPLRNGTARSKVNGAPFNATRLLRDVTVLIGYFTGNINAVLRVCNSDIAIRVVNSAVNANIRCIKRRIACFSAGCIFNSNLRIITGNAICLISINSNAIIFVIRGIYRGVIVKHAAAVALNGNIVNTQEEISIVGNCYGRRSVSSNCAFTIQRAAGNVNVAAGYLQIFKFNGRHSACTLGNANVTFRINSQQTQCLQFILNTPKFIRISSTNIRPGVFLLHGNKFIHSLKQAGCIIRHTDFFNRAAVAVFIPLRIFRECNGNIISLPCAVLIAKDKRINSISINAFFQRIIISIYCRL